MPKKTTKPISAKANSKAGAGCGVLFGLIFFLAGFGFFLFTFLIPVGRIVAGRGWVATPCVVVNSNVVSHRGSKSTSYETKISYQYRVAGQIYTSELYSFSAFNNGNGPQGVAATLPPGTRTTCFVNPDNPGEAVLNNGFNKELLIGLFPLIHLVVGLVIIVASLRGGFGKFKTGKANWRPGKQNALPSAPNGEVSAQPMFQTAPPKSQTQLVQELQAQAASPFEDISATRHISSMPQFGSGPVTLKPASSKVAAFGCLFAFGLIWNGGIGIAMFQSFSSSNGDSVGKFFLIPFVLIGLGILAAAGYQFLAIFGPKLEVTVSTAAVALGEPLSIDWRLIGNQRVQGLKISLEGREEATYRRGTDTYTDRNVFCTLDIVGDAGSATQGSGRVVIPAGSMHSFAATNNKIVWQIVAKGDIPIWPNLKEEFPFVVLPKGGEA